MGNTIEVHVKQIGVSASEGMARGHHVVMDRPEAKGGENRGAMGGEHLLMALGGCFMSNLLAAAHSRETAVSDVQMEISGNLESGPPRYTAVDVRISAQYEDRAMMEKLITIAEKGCIVANTLRSALALSISLKK